MKSAGVSRLRAPIGFPRRGEGHKFSIKSGKMGKTDVGKGGKKSGTGTLWKSNQNTHKNIHGETALK